MTSGRDLVLLALDNQPTSRTPWVPYVGVHGGALIGATATELLHSADLLHRAHLESIRRYRPDGLPVTVDLALEAEAMGCQLQWTDEMPPSVISHPLAHGKLSDIPFPNFDIKAGRLPIILESLTRLRHHAGDSLAIYAAVTGPLTLAMQLRGKDFLYDIFNEPDGVMGLISHCAEVGRIVAETSIRHGADVVAVVDPMVSQVSPEIFDDLVAPAENRILDAVRAHRAHGALMVGGEVTPLIDRLFSTRCHCVCLGENIPLALVRKVAQRHGKSFGGNLSVKTVLMMGSEAEVRRHAVECLDAGGNIGHILSPAGDLPYHVPPANIELVASVVQDPAQREMAHALSHISSDALHVGHGWADVADEGVVIDVITSDSEKSAPCRVMLEAARRAAATIGGPVFVREHKIGGPKGTPPPSAAKVTDLPTLCIDGDPVFVSIIPDQSTLIKAIKERMTTRSLR